MYKFCFLVACLACINSGRRLKATFGQHSSSQEVYAQGPMKQLNSSTVFRSHGQGHRSGSGQFAKSKVDPRKVVSILLTSPAIVRSLVAPPQPWDMLDQIKVSSAFRGIAPLSDPVREWLDNFKQSTSVHSSIHDEAYFDVDPTSAEAASDPEVWGPTVRIVVSVEWEGLYLQDRNLQFFKDFREAHPEVPLTHFLNAAYFTTPDWPTQQEWSPHQALSPIDEIGLQISGLKSLVDASGVQFRSEPNTLQSPEEIFEEGKWLSERTGRDSAYDSEKERERIQRQNEASRSLGWDVDIRAYSVDELRAIISKSRAILEQNRLKVGKSFRVGDRLAGPRVLEAFRLEGFKINSSAVGPDDATWPRSIAEEAFWRDAPLSAMLRDIWPGVTKDSQPSYVETPVGMILEMPDTGCSAGHGTGFATVEDVVDHIDRAVQQLDLEDRFVNLGFHQETAASYGAIVSAAITEIKRKHGHRVVFETLRKSARRASSSLPLLEMAAGMRPLGWQSNCLETAAEMRPPGMRNNSSWNHSATWSVRNNSSSSHAASWSARDTQQSS